MAASAVATTTPGRIYAEARSVDQVIKLARSFGELNPLKISPVPQEDIFKILGFSHSHIDWPWARVKKSRGKWSCYEGDTGLITKVEGRHKKFLALIPRIGGLGEVREGHYRPPPALAVRRDLDIRRDAQAGLPDRFIWDGQTFSAEGFLIVDLDNIPILPLLKPLPSSAELAIFRSTSLLSTAEANTTSQQIARARMKVGDRVKVVSGPYYHMIGEVKALKENEVAIYLSSQDVTEDMPMDTVRAEFKVGDQVKALDGQNKGVVGWVVGISEDMLRILDVKYTFRGLNLEDPKEVDTLHL